MDWERMEVKQGIRYRAPDVHADAVPDFAAVPNHMLTDPFAWIDWCISTWLHWIVDAL